MNRDDIIRWARGCGLTINDQPMLGVERFANLVAAEVRNETVVILERGDVAMEKWRKRIKRMKSEGWRQCAIGQSETQHCGQLEAAVAAEREACAEICDKWMPWTNPSAIGEVKRVAAAIRARGE